MYRTRARLLISQGTGRVAVRRAADRLEATAGRSGYRRRRQLVHPPDADALSASDTVRWDGRRFADWWTLRSYVTSRGVAPNGFLLDHPSVVKTFELKPLHWDGKTFYVRRTFTRYLRDHGVKVAAWQKHHPNVLSHLNG